jgi:hypothetical protein
VPVLSTMVTTASGIARLTYSVRVSCVINRPPVWILHSLSESQSRIP